MELENYTQHQKKSIVEQINAFEESALGSYIKALWQAELDTRLDYAIETPIDNKFTVLAREGLLGEIRQLKSCSTEFSRLRDNLVDEIKQEEENKEQNS